MSAHRGANINTNMSKAPEGPEIVQLENAEQHVDMVKDKINYDRIDKEVAKYASDGVVIVSNADNRRLVTSTQQSSRMVTEDAFQIEENG